MKEKGAKLTAVQDHTGTIYNENGIDPHDLLAYTQKNGGGIANYPKAEAIDNSKFFGLKCDILIPAALGSQITGANADSIQAKVIAEGANGPTTPEGEEILLRKGINIIPDILCNSGGVIGSYYEWLQNRNGEIWQMDDVIYKLEKKLINSFKKVVNASEEYKVDLRTAAYIVAIRRIELTYRERGVFP